VCLSVCVCVRGVRVCVCVCFFGVYVCVWVSEWVWVCWLIACASA